MTPTSPGAISSVSAMLALLAALLITGCDVPNTPAEPDRTDAAGDRQTAFRVRSDFDADLNSHTGWAAAVNAPATVEADRPFRIRFEVEAGKDPAPRRYGLQFRRNDGDWQPLQAEDFPYPQKRVELALDGAGDQDLDGAWSLRRGTPDVIRRHPEDPGAIRVETARQALHTDGRYTIHWRPSELAVELLLPDVPDARAGLVLAERDSGGHLWLELAAPDTLRLINVDDDRNEVLATTRSDLGLGRWVELKAVFDDAKLAIELDDRAVFEQPLPPDLAPRLGLNMPAGSVAEFRAFTIEGESSTPRTSIISSPAFSHSARTEDLLLLSERPFTGGAGLSFAPTTPDWTPDGGHGEWSVPIVIRRFADEAEMNEAGDRFEYRLVSADGSPIPSAAPAVVTLAVPDGHLGGTFVETPMRLGPWQSATGDLHFIMEPAETWNRPMMMVSSDDGRRWREADGAHRPMTGDLEGLATAFSDGRIHVLHQISEAVLYHAFDTSERTEGDGHWAVRDELVAEMPEPPTQVADLAVRSDGTLVAVYAAGDGLHIRVRGTDGRWREEQAIEHPSGLVLSGPTLAVGAGDSVHLAYTASDGSGWLRTMGIDESIGAAVRFTDQLGTGESDVGALLPLQVLEKPAGDTVVVLYRAADGRLYERRLRPDGRLSDSVQLSPQAVAQNAVDSDQVGADVVVDGDRLHVLFIDADTGHLHHVRGREGEWGASQAVITDATVQWVRGQVIETEHGHRVYGFVYDAGSSGGSGMNRYAEIPLR